LKWNERNPSVNSSKISDIHDKRKVIKRYRQRENQKKKRKKQNFSCNPYLMVIFRIKNSLQAKIKSYSSELEQKNVISAS
jgi:hypothetical protein